MRCVWSLEQRRQLLKQARADHVGVFAVGAQPQIGLLVEGLALLQKFVQSGGRIACSQQWPSAGISLEPAQELVFGDIQPNHDPLAQFAPVRWRGDDAATGGHHQRMPLA